MSRRFVLAVAALSGGLSLGSGAALADGGALVRGGAPLPQFSLDYLLKDAARAGMPLVGAGENLEIAVTAPDSGVFRFLFSPRPQFGFGVDRATGANRSYAGLTWNVFDSSSVFGNVGVAGTYDVPGNFDPLHRSLAQPLTLHGAVEFGYHLDSQNSLSLSLDHGNAPELRLGGSGDDNLLRLHYGLKF